MPLKRKLPKLVINQNPTEYTYPFTSKERERLKTDGSIFLSRSRFRPETNQHMPSGTRVPLPPKCTFFFGQSGVKNRFNNGPYAGRTIRDAALEAYVTGYYHPLKFHYVERKVGNSDTVKIAENNRTLTFFCMLGISPVDPICKTGVSSHEKAVIKHSKGMKKCYSDSILVRGM
ncbi:hypothetical protein OQJ15_11515 [Fluoribacter dumoffii]|uniref:hypothetical protein n=1 Tax=Fluoribacter dumoffii TaxID=463 RepID=UPI0022441D67|nr:hypothetical protein [Fluoribacter dumoffii]MCW8386936.1 hypothetical protein [Fluoribacter dumoffii]MCW8497138.1 hypothetical protein [Fluoribacter dumoffii]